MHERRLELLSVCRRTLISFILSVLSACAAFILYLNYLSGRGQAFFISTAVTTAVTFLFVAITLIGSLIVCMNLNGGAVEAPLDYD